jgi:hypothetical protein
MPSLFEKRNLRYTYNYFKKIPLTPPELRAAISAKTLGRDKPPEKARYLGFHIGSNLFLYALTPWKL